jgi:hypothetical protein
LPLVLARSLGTRSLRVSALRFQRGSCRPRKPASRVCCRHKRTPREFFRRYGPCNTPPLLSNDLLEMRVGDETRASGRERPGDAKVGYLALAIAERPATPDPRIRTIVRSLIQEATSAVSRPGMAANLAVDRPTDAAVPEPRTRPGAAVGTHAERGRANTDALGGPRIASDTCLLLRPVCDRRILAVRRPR